MLYFGAIHCVRDTEQLAANYIFHQHNTHSHHAITLFLMPHMHNEFCFRGSVTQYSKSAGRNLGDHSGGTCCASYMVGILSLRGRSIKVKIKAISV